MGGGVLEAGVVRLRLRWACRAGAGGSALYRRRAQATRLSASSRVAVSWRPH